MNYFYAVVHKNGDSAFGVIFPDLPGCFSAADRAEDIIPNAVEALELWFDDQPEVEPMRLDEIQAAAADELAEGAFIIAVPRIVNDHRVVRANISLESGVLDAIDRAAADPERVHCAGGAEGDRGSTSILEMPTATP